MTERRSQVASRAGSEPVAQDIPERAVAEALRRLGCDTAPVAWVLHFNDPDPQTDIEFCRECPPAWAGKAEPLYEGPGIRPFDARMAIARLAWLHSSESNDVEGYECGIYRVKWENGQAAEVWQTASDFSDLDAARKAAPIAPAAAAEPVKLTDKFIDSHTAHIYHRGKPVDAEYRIGIVRAVQDNFQRVYGLARIAPAAEPRESLREMTEGRDHNKERSDFYRKRCKELEADRERAASLVASEDTKRLDWLESNLTWQVNKPEEFDGDEAIWSVEFRSTYGVNETQDDLRPAIDAARASAGEAQS